MLREEDLQDWCVQHAERGTLVTVIEDGNRPDTVSDDWTPPPEFGIDPDMPLAQKNIANYRRICTGLLDAEVVTADQDLGLTGYGRFKPDLLLHNASINAYIIVELKVGTDSERQAITELLAYAEALRRAYHGPEIHLIVASREWRDLLRSAVAGYLRDDGYRLLPLIVTPLMASTEESSLDSKFRLTIHWDLIRDHQSSPLITAGAFACDTASFTFRDYSPFDGPLYGSLNRLVADQALALAQRAEHARPARPGFVLVWQASYQTWNITTCILNEARLAPNVPTASRLHRFHHPESDDIYGWMPPADIDAGAMLLDKVVIDCLGTEVERGGFTDWVQAQLLLRHQCARVLFAVGWGEMRAMFNDAAPLPGPRHDNLDLRRFRGNHLFRWLPQIDSITMADFVPGDLDQPSTLCALGGILGRVTDYYAGEADLLEDTDDFGYLAACARLVDAWNRLQRAWVHLGRAETVHFLRFERPDATRLRIYEIDRLRAWCIGQLCGQGGWHLFAYRLGASQGFGERHRQLKLLDGIAPESLVQASNLLLEWAAGVEPHERTAGHADALAYLEDLGYFVSGEARLTADELVWRDNVEALAELASAAAASASAPAGPWQQVPAAPVTAHEGAIGTF